MTRIPPATTYAPFLGDGRKKDVRPLRGDIKVRGFPLWVTNAQARRQIDNLRQEGHSNHSPLLGTLWVAELWAKTQGLDYNIKFFYDGNRCIGAFFTLPWSTEWENRASGSAQPSEACDSAPGSPKPSLPSASA